MTPATNVPWKERSRSSGAPLDPAAAKPRAAITFGVVAPATPFGKPGGYENPAGLKNGCAWSIPSSTTATLTPSPFAPVSDENAGAPSTDGPRFRSRWYVRLG